jgi:GNAT superfamily N-acetyltransferase
VGASGFTVRSYRPSDREGVRAIYGHDEFGRPSFTTRFQGYGRYLADGMSHYTAYEPESAFVAVEAGAVAGALLGAVSTERCERVYEPRVRRILARRCLAGVYGWPGWLRSVLLTELANRGNPTPRIDLSRYPAHLHVGIRPERRRRGMGTALMEHFSDYLARRGVPGYHLLCSSFHPLGLSFYRKLGLAEAASFRWRFHDGEALREVTEIVFVQSLP